MRGCSRRVAMLIAVVRWTIAKLLQCIGATAMPTGKIVHAAPVGFDVLGGVHRRVVVIGRPSAVSDRCSGCRRRCGGGLMVDRVDMWTIIGARIAAVGRCRRCAAVDVCL